MAEKKEAVKKDSDGGLAVTSVTMSLLAGVIARILAKMTPAKAKEYLQDPERMLGIKLPTEFATTILGGFAGWTMLKIMVKFFPDLKPSEKDFITDLAVMVGEEYDDVIKLEAKGGQANAPTAGSNHGETPMQSSPEVWVHKDNPTVGFSGRCQLRHHLEEVEAGKKNRRTSDGSEVASTKWVPKPGYYQVDLARFEGRPPDSPEPGCGCRAEIEDWKAQREKQRAEAAKPQRKRDPLITHDDVRKAGKFVADKTGAFLDGVGAAGKATGHAIGSAAKATGRAIDTGARAVGREAQRLNTEMAGLDASWSNSLKTRTDKIKADAARRRGR